MWKRKPIPKKARKAVYAKYGGRCAYCGRELLYKEMQVDHLEPVAFMRGGNGIGNLMPACRRCNFYKGCFSLEGFREQLAEIPRRLREHKNHSMIYNLALMHGLVEETGRPVKFHFEGREPSQEWKAYAAKERENEHKDV